ncbi:MAG: hypothetical protein KIH67_003145 [Candidatus Moranbacteria bacterium]|nr:hypothetical protein [Candidatus Moranbacteria bacterium]
MFEIPKVEKPKTKLSIEPGLVVPEAFRESPWQYFEEHGLNIKPGETEHKEDGSIKEDPTAVKCLPVWHDQEGNSIRVIAKKINPAKGEAAKTGNPWHETDVMMRVAEAGLPVARLLAITEDEGQYLFFTERVAGFTVYDTAMLDEKFAAHDYTKEDVEELKSQVQREMELLKNKLEAEGIVREKWKIQDMIFEIDFAERKVTKVTPVDWERTKLLPKNKEEVVVAEPKTRPIWDAPDSPLFYDWYEGQRVLSDDKQSDAFREFLALVKLGQAELPRHLAHYRVQKLRDRQG